MRNQGKAPHLQRVRVSWALRLIGAIGIGLGLATVLWSTQLYCADHEFSFFSTYLSDIGATPVWPKVVFNTGMLLIAPVRYLFLGLLVLRLLDFGASMAFSAVALVIGAFVVAGSVGMSAVPFSLDLALHKSSALIYFFGVVALQTLIGVTEWRLRLPLSLPVSTMAVVVVYLVFAVLMAMVGKAPGITRNTPVIWEWLAFCSLMVWLLAHSVVLGQKTPEEG